MALPGVKTVIKDRFYSISRQDIPVGPRVCLIAQRGVAVAGDNSAKVKDLDVVQATTEQDVIDVFGENSAIHRGFLELITGGAERIYIVPLPYDSVWDHSLATITSSSNAGVNVFDAAFAAAEASQPDIIVPWGRGSKSTDWQSPATPGDDEEIGFYANNSTTSTSWAYKVAVKVKEINENSHPCFAVMGVKPYQGTGSGASETMTPAEIATHLGSSGTSYSALNTLINRDGGTIDEIGRHVVIIATELKPVNYPESFGYANGATTLAAAISRMSSFTSPVNKTAYNVSSIRYNPTRTQQLTLSNAGVNCLALNFNKVPTFIEGLTIASSTSDYTRISTMRIINEAVLLVRQVCQKFIGEASTIQTRNSMETAITSALRGMQQLGALLDSDFTVSYVPAENKALIDLVLTPAFELKNIEVQVSINL
jgi:hypothetical protein